MALRMLHCRASDSVLMCHPSQENISQLVEGSSSRRGRDWGGKLRIFCATNSVLSEQLQPAHHRPRLRFSSRLDVNPTSYDAAGATALDVRSSGAATSCYWSPPSSQPTPQLPQPVAPGPLHLPAALTATATAPPG